MLTSDGTVFSFAPLGSPLENIARLSKIGDMTIERQMIDTTPIDSPGGWRSYAPGMIDGGSVTIEGFFENSQCQALLINALISGIDANARITFSDASHTDFNCRVTSCSIGASTVDGAMAFRSTVKITGAVTYTRQ